MKSITEAIESFKTVGTSLNNELKRFLAPFADVLPDARYRRSLFSVVAGMLAASSPQLARAAAYAPDRPIGQRALVKRFYNLVRTNIFSYDAWLEPLYADAMRSVSVVGKERALVSVDPLYLEKPYAQKQEGLSVILKSRPPGSLPRKEPRKTRGYPTIFGLVLNGEWPAVAYFHLFSYVSEEFVSQPKEWMKAFGSIKRNLPGRKVCVVADAEADSQGLWFSAGDEGIDFIFRATKERNIEVWNPKA